jgi:hypothetical protein
MAKPPEDMPPRQTVKSGQKVPLELAEAERKLILDDLIYVKREYADAIRATAADKAVEFTLTNWEELGDGIAVEANRTRDRRLKRSLDQLFAKINALTTQRPTRAPNLKNYRGDEDAS